MLKIDKAGLQSSPKRLEKTPCLLPPYLHPHSYIFVECIEMSASIYCIKIKRKGERGRITNPEERKLDRKQKKQMCPRSVSAPPCPT